MKIIKKSIKILKLFYYLKIYWNFFKKNVEIKMSNVDSVNPKITQFSKYDISILAFF